MTLICLYLPVYYNNKGCNEPLDKELSDYSISKNVQLICFCNNDNNNTRYNVMNSNDITNKYDMIKLTYTCIIVFTLILITLVILKSAIECAIQSRTQLSKLREQEGNNISNLIARKPTYSSRTDD